MDFCFFLLHLDDLFGQCWNGEGSIRKAFLLPDGIDGISEEKLLVLGSTIDFLNRYQLTWRDFLSQCIVSHVLINDYSFDRNRLQSLYEDCLDKDQILDDLATENIHRRTIEHNQRMYCFSQIFIVDGIFLYP